VADLEQRIVAEGSDTVAMVIIEPVQNHGACRRPAGTTPACARCATVRHLLVADETITPSAGSVPGSPPSATTCGPTFTPEKGCPRHAVLGAIIVSDDVFAPFDEAGRCCCTATRSAAIRDGGGRLRNLEICSASTCRAGCARSRASCGPGSSRFRLDVVVDVRGPGSSRVELARTVRTAPR